jgi:hypothetical protein
MLATAWRLNGRRIGIRKERSRALQSVIDTGVVMCGDRDFPFEESDNGY